MFLSLQALSYKLCLTNFNHSIASSDMVKENIEQ